MYKLTNSTGVIRTSDDALVPADADNADWQKYQQWLAAGNTPLPADVPPEPPSIEEQVAVFDAALVAHLDATARERRYDNRVTCALRAGYPGPFQAEGIAFASWMDQCNALAYNLLAEVVAGTRLLPDSPQVLIDLMPAMVWPS